MSAFRSFLVALCLSLSVLHADDPSLDFSRWEKDIATLEAKKNAPNHSPGALLFVGSSSIRLWDLPASWPKEKTINQGFGGSLLADTLHFFDRIVTPFQPRAILVYAGDNDIAKGRTAEQVIEDFRALVRLWEARLPQTPLVFIAIKPSRKRWELWPEMKRANEAIAKICEDTLGLHYADIATPMLEKADGAPGEEWFLKDGLHLSPMGYARWTEVINQVLSQAKP